VSVVAQKQQGTTTVAFFPFNINPEAILVESAHFLCKVQKEKIHWWFLVPQVESCKDGV
jgi:hypothetical protein